MIVCRAATVVEYNPAYPVLPVSMCLLRTLLRTAFANSQTQRTLHGDGVLNGGRLLISLAYRINQNPSSYCTSSLSFDFHVNVVEFFTRHSHTPYTRRVIGTVPTYLRIEKNTRMSECTLPSPFHLIFHVFVTSELTTRRTMGIGNKLPRAWPIYCDPDNILLGEKNSQKMKEIPKNTTMQISL